jgi:hypothetical protein
VSSFMEGARRIEDPLFASVCYCLVEGALEERGRKLADTCWSEAREDMFGGGLR